MKKLFKKLAHYLYLKYGDINFTEMTRLQLQGVSDKVDLNNLDTDTRTSFLVECDQLLKNEVLNQIIKDIEQDCVNKIVYEVKSEQEANFNRFTINGASLVVERLKKYSSQLPKKETNFDPFSPI